MFFFVITTTIRKKQAIILFEWYIKFQNILRTIYREEILCLNNLIFHIQKKHPFLSINELWRFCQITYQQKLSTTHGTLLTASVYRFTMRAVGRVEICKHCHERVRVCAPAALVATRPNLARDAILAYTLTTLAAQCILFSYRVVCVHRCQVARSKLGVCHGIVAENYFFSCYLNYLCPR